jgi:uncharacterized NAD(P)/FAD-binding protein YdhS
MSNLSSPPRIAIIGAGVSGALLAAQLLRHASSPLRVLLVERSAEFGPGVAYRTRSPDHLLNVTAARMGAFPEDSGHFLRWLRANAHRDGFLPRVEPNDYVSRQLYGTYVQQVLDDAQSAAASNVGLERIRGEAVDIDESSGARTIKLREGSTIIADRVVLAIGNLPGEYPIPRPLPVYRSHRYVHVPWEGNALAGIDLNDDVMLVGQGLTATDLILQLAQRGHRGTIHAVSRHGIRPQVHDPNATPRPGIPVDSVRPTIRAWTRRVREEILAAEAEGRDWRTVMDGLRPHVQAIWQTWSWEERARFLRHIRPLWEAHRHRIPPATAARVQQLVDDGRLKFYAGRLQVLEESERGLHALLRRRGSIQHVALHVTKVINCTGPRTDYTKFQHPLLTHLLARGLIDHDPLALGINAQADGEVLRYRGGPTGWLYTLGAPLKGVLWETTAVAEIREQARALAVLLLRQVNPQV